MQPVRAVVDALAGDLERAGQAPDAVGAFQQSHLQPAPGSTPGGGEPGRPGAEDDEIRRAVHGCPTTLSPRPEPGGRLTIFAACRRGSDLALQGTRTASAVGSGA